LVSLADLFEKGVLPVAGGALDQSASFIEAARFLSVEDAIHKAERHG
jgi:hypothetical protein